MAHNNDMHDISRFDRVHAKFDTYVRELEQLATECFDHLQLLEASPLDPLAVAHIRQGLKRRLAIIQKATRSNVIVRRYQRERTKPHDQR